MDSSSDSSPSKRHKKHKHKKHKKKKQEDSDGSIDMSIDDDPIPTTIPTVISKSPISQEKLKPSISKQPEKPTTSNQSGNFAKPVPVKKKKAKGRDSGTSSEEERWLDAIESGKLEDVDDELKKIKPKDPKLMTARQRAMYERGNDKESGEILMALPSGYKEKVMTAEAIQKAALKSQKRKQLADEKREKNKKRTMDRLLKKQDSKATKQAKARPLRPSMPVITYKNSVNGITVSFPQSVEFPLKKKVVCEAPKPQKCGVLGCDNYKIYRCSRTDVALCSIACYKRNITAHILS